MSGMTTELDALLASVRAAPADDLPRLVVADWLEEHGEPDRAEFIRVQVRLASLRSTPAAGTILTREFTEMAGREIALLPVVVTPTVGQYPHLGLLWRRGFVEVVTGPLAAIRTNLPDILRGNPTHVLKVTDRQALYAEGTEEHAPGRHVWLSGGGATRRGYTLPPELFARMAGEMWPGRDDMRIYALGHEANADLTAGLFAEARGRI